MNSMSKNTNKVEKKCNELRNPFIKDSSNEIYAISNKIIEDIRNDYVGQNNTKLTKLKIFKKNILPKIMIYFKKKYTDFNMFNAHAMELLLISNNFKQFNKLYFNREYFPELDGINQLIENKNSLPENSKVSTIDSLYKDIENSEHIYFEKNKIYKENILKFITALSKKYFTEFRLFSDFQTTKSIVELNALNAYFNFLQTVPSLIITKSNNDVKKEINKNFNILISIFPSSEYELFPHEIEDFITIEKSIKNNKNIRKYKYNENSKKVTDLKAKIEKLTGYIKYYSDGFQKEIQKEENYYIKLIKQYSTIIKHEQKEEVIFKDLQFNRNKLNEKIREIGKGIQDKKYSQIVIEVKESYTNYTTHFYDKLKLYETLYGMIYNPEKKISTKIKGGDTSTATTSATGAATTGSTTNSSVQTNNKKSVNNSENSSSKIELEHFELYYIFKSIFNLIIDNNSLIDKDESILRTKVPYYLYKEENKGINDINLESLRNKDKRNIYDFVLNMNDIFDHDEIFFNNYVEKLNEIKSKVTREITVLQTMESSAKAQVTNKGTYTTELESEKRKMDDEIRALTATVTQKKQSIDRELNSGTIKDIFGQISLSDISKIDDQEGLLEMFMKKNFKSYDVYLNDEIYPDIDKNTKKEVYGKNFNEILAISSTKSSPYYKLFDLIKFKKNSKYASSKPSEIEIDNKINDFKTALTSFLIQIGIEAPPTGVAPITISTDEQINKIKDFLKKYAEKHFEPFYLIESQSISDKDPKYKQARDSFISVRSSYNIYNEDLLKLQDLQQKVSTIIYELREIREGPEEYTKQLNAKKTFNSRLDEQLNELNSILQRKKDSNKELKDLIGTESFKTNMDEMYGALIMRYKSIYTLIKKKIIQSEVYNMFNDDTLYKTIKALHDLLTQIIKIDKRNGNKVEGTLEKESVVEVVKSFQNYVNKRLEDFPKVIEKSEGEIRFKKYHIRSMADVLKGQKFGNYEISKNTDMKKFIKKVKDQNVDDLLTLVKTLYEKEVTIDQVDKDKLKYYIQTYGNKVSNTSTKKINVINTSKTNIFANNIKPFSVIPINNIKPLSEIPINNTKINRVANNNIKPLSAIPINSTKPITPINSKTPLRQSGGSSNKQNQLITLNQSKEKSFMKNIYNILLEDNSKSSKDFVNRLKQYEYKLLNQAKAKIRTFTYLYDRGNKTGTDKINNHMLYIYNMTKICLDDFDKELTEIFKRGKSSNERVNILLISKYIYMEVIMIYTLSYFC